MVMTSSIGLGVTRLADGFRVEGGATVRKLEIVAGDVKLTAQQNSEMVLPDFAQAHLLAQEIFSAKGSLIGFDGTDAVEVPVGLDGQFIVADSTQAAGLAYKTVQFVEAEVVNASKTMEANKAYFVDDASAALVVLTLPDGAATALGARIKIYGGTSADKWQIAQAGAADQIRLLDAATTLGVTGVLTSLQNNDSIELEHRGAGVWQVADCMGSFDLA